MSFLSPDIFLGLVTVLAAAWMLPRAIQLPGVALLTAFFMFIFAPASFAVLLITTVVTYYSHRIISPANAVIIVSIAGLVAVFLLAKSFNNIFSIVPNQQVVTLGLFFYTLRQIHYMAELYKKKLPPHSFLEYLCYLFFLPTLLAGPINTFSEFNRDMRRRRFDTEALSAGLERILYGYVKIIVLANWLVTGKITALVEAMAIQHPSAAAYLDCVRYGLNLYFQFSGYSDIAIGFSLAMGFRIIENFNHPYLAVNIGDFWQRWHYSLSKWCRDYIFMPILSITRRPVIAVLASMLVIGLWHELSLRYLVWALYHGTGIALWHFFQRFKRRFHMREILWQRRGLAFLSLAFTVNFVFLSFAITKSDNLHEAFRLYLVIFGLGEK